MKNNRDVLSRFFSKLYQAQEAEGLYVLEEIAEILKFDLDEAAMAWNELDYLIGADEDVSELKVV